MSEQQQAAQAQQPLFNIEKLYVKDVSLEVPGAPKVFLEREQPQVDMELSTKGEKIDDGYYHVELKVTVTAKYPTKTLFLIEASQCGVFQIRGVPDADMEPVLSVACPNILFPYAREVVSDLSGRAGFPPVVLAPVNFEGLYLQRLQQQQEQPAANDAPATTH